MAQTVHVGMKGLQEIQAAIRRLDSNAEGAYKKAVRAGGRILRNAMRKSREFKDVTGTLRKNIDMADGSERRELFTVKVGPSKKAPHGHLVELGHRMVDRAGRVVGRVAPRPFMRKALDETGTEIVREIGSTFFESVTRI